jgi:subtilase family serine protease
LGYVTLAFKKSDAQQAALEQLLRQQQEPASPLFRKWLTPEQYADRFGLSQDDIVKITAWLGSSGFNVIRVARGRDFIVFSGTAREVESALRTPIHRYLVNGEQHYANEAEPSLPLAIADVVAGFQGLDDFRPEHPRSRLHPLANPRSQPTPSYADPQSGLSGLSPSDLATIYDIQPLYQNGFDGTGQTVVVAGQTNVDLNDIRAFHQAFNLPARDPKLLLVPGAPDPGIVSKELMESDMDLELVGAIAPNAIVLFVYSPNVFNSVEYAIDNALAPVISFSFGGCELRITESQATALESEAQKANLEGITWVASSGDSGAAACEDQNGTATAATTGMSVNIPASLPEVTSVGGTELAEGAATYWGTNNSALSYIPEGTWNDSALISSLVMAGLIPGGFAASGGGVSSLYSKPFWQTGPGVPNDGRRDVPDIALTASGAHDPYAIVTGGQSSWGGGTSAAAPTFAGMVALLNQYWGTTGLGNINPNLYALAQSVPGIFHDITTGNNIVPCQIGSPNCQNGSFGYNAGLGYDQVTGLGSVDATQLVTNWTTLPYLVITGLTSDTVVLPGGRINLSVTVANRGAADAGPFRIGEYFSTSPALSPSFIASGYFAYCDLSGLAAGATTTCSGPVNVPAGMQTGRYNLIAVTDVLHQLVQYYQAQNARLSDSGLVTISSSCSYSLSNSAEQFPASGGTGSFTVQTQAGCPWSAAPNVNWISISGVATGTGSGTLSFLVTPNIGAARTGIISVANQQFTVSQAAVANLTLQFTNSLIYPVTISINGSPIGTVNASSTGSFTISAPQTLAVSFVLERPTVGGVPIGDPMVGYWNTVNNPVGAYSFAVSNQIGSQQYFAPIITNTSGVPLLMAVNFGLAAENLCHCVVPVGGTNVGIGYYRLFSNSTVDAFLSTSNYSGQYSYFNNLISLVQVQTGALYLTFNRVP